MATEVKMATLNQVELETIDRIVSGLSVLEGGSNVIKEERYPLVSNR